MKSTATVHISVRPLVGYVYRSGSIIPGFRSTGSMQEGTRVHQSVQAQYKETDRKEVFLKAEIVHGDLLFLVEGRCDGLIELDGILTVDEIKSFAGAAGELEGDGLPVHWAQAMLYAYMIAKEESMSSIQVQLTYVQQKPGETRRFLRQFSLSELEDFVHSLLASYAPYARLLADHKERRDDSIRTLEFPFEQYRAGQRKLAGSVYKTIAEGVNLFAKAPTGIGKTISTLYPAVKSVTGEGIQRIFYLTARTTTRATAEEAFALMQRKGLHMHIITLTAKDKICFKDKNNCDAGECGMCDGYYDRINGAVMDILEHETIMTRPVVEAYARKHSVCPFEFSLDVAYASDAVICDYNYVFDPRISLKRQLEEQKRKSVLLVDEAHNLVERGRDMYSAEIGKSVFLQLKRMFKTLNPEVASAAGAVNAYFIKLRKALTASGLEVSAEQPRELVELLASFTEAAERELLAPAGVHTEAHPLLLDTYFAAQNMIRISGLYDARYVTYSVNTREDLTTRLFCLDPSALIAAAVKGYRSAVYFSATLSPLSFYRDMLGAGEDDYSLHIPSPFQPGQWDVRLYPLSIRYRDRERSIRPIADMLETLAAEKKGNLLIFFPSYPYLREVAEEFMNRDTDTEILLQNPGMREEERDAFLAAFQPCPERTRMGFAVLGGVFAEGVDLPGERLNGVVVVGVGLPQIGAERDILRSYFERNGKNGFNYAYVYPGMNKVLQAGGRLIRTEADEGVLVLVDDRFVKEPYASLLPEEWRHFRLLGKGTGRIQNEF